MATTTRSRSRKRTDEAASSSRARKQTEEPAKPRRRAEAKTSSVGRSHEEASASRAARSSTYREARAEYEQIRALRETHPIAAHLRERRVELSLTQQEVAEAAQTTKSAISRLEKGTFIPKLATLQRIAAVLDEELTLCFTSSLEDEVEREFTAIA